MINIVLIKDQISHNLIFIICKSLEKGYNRKNIFNGCKNDKNTIFNIIIYIKSAFNQKQNQTK